MTTPKSLPARPSLDSLRKQAKKLTRRVAAGDAEAVGRARTQLPDAELPLSLRDAQLVLAREYGFAGWRELIAAVHERLGTGLEWAAARARGLIHDNDVERLKQLLADHPALLSWRSEEDEGGLLGIATSSFGDSFDSVREAQYTRPACAELLIDAGAVVTPSVCESLIESRARGLLRLFQRKGLLPHALRFLAATGDLDDVRARLAEGDSDIATVNEAFLCACRLEHRDVATLLLDRSIALDAALGERIGGGPGRAGLIEYLIEERTLDFTHAAPDGPWHAFVMHRVTRAIHDGDLEAFTQAFDRDPWLLDDARVGFQVGLIERATLRDRGAFIEALLDLHPALVRRQPPPSSQAIEFAFTYAKPHLVPTLTRIWPLPDDLPHAAGMGDLGRVRRWFDGSGEPALGDPAQHFPGNSAYTRSNLRWGAPAVQHVLDTALAWAVLNSHFDIADLLLEHGADINTRWGSHEPASILHELVYFHENYEAMQFLIDRGIDTTIADFRWGATAEGWARHSVKNESMARWLAERARPRV